MIRVISEDFNVILNCGGPLGPGTFALRSLPQDCSTALRITCHTGSNYSGQPRNSGKSINISFLRRLMPSAGRAFPVIPLPLGVQFAINSGPKIASLAISLHKLPHFLSVIYFG